MPHRLKKTDSNVSIGSTASSNSTRNSTSSTCISIRLSKSKTDGDGSGGVHSPRHLPVGSSSSSDQATGSNHSSSIIVFPSSSTFPATNPKPMQQFPHNHNSRAGHHTRSRHSKLRSSESTTGGSFFAKLAGSKGSGSRSPPSSAVNEEAKQSTYVQLEKSPSGSLYSPLPSYTPLEWSCRAELDDDWGILSAQEPFSEQSPQMRTPSLTHSRASSSDSAASSALSFEDKPLPAIPPLPLTPGWNKGRRFSVAFVEQIRDVPTLTLAVTDVTSDEPSSDQPPAVESSMAHLDLAVSDRNKTLSVISGTSTVCPSKTPRRRPLSRFSSKNSVYTSSSANSIWTSRESTWSSPETSSEEDSFSGPFSLEAVLAEQEEIFKTARAAAKLPTSRHDNAGQGRIQHGKAPNPPEPEPHPKAVDGLSTLYISTSKMTSSQPAWSLQATNSGKDCTKPMLVCKDISGELEEMEQKEEFQTAAAEQRAAKIANLAKLSNDQPTITFISSPASPVSPSHSTPLPPSPVHKKQNIKRKAPGKVVINSVWRGWMSSGSQGEPAAVGTRGVGHAGVPQLELSSPLSPKHKHAEPDPADYFAANFGVGMEPKAPLSKSTSKKSSISIRPEMISRPIPKAQTYTPAFQVPHLLQPAVQTSTSPLPKLSPDFSFGRTTPAADGEPSKIPASSSYGQSRRNRAASAQPLGMHRANQPSVSVSQTRPAGICDIHHSQQTVHRNKLASRRHASVGPRDQSKIIDLETLNRLRDRASSIPKYEWI